MYSYRFDPNDAVLYAEMTGSISSDDVFALFATYEDPRFTPAHQVLVDLRDAYAGFNFDTFEEANSIFGRRNRRGMGTRTAFVSRSGTIRALIAVARDTRRVWGTDWGIFEDLESAKVWLSEGKKATRAANNQVPEERLESDR